MQRPSGATAAFAGRIANVMRYQTSFNDLGLLGPLMGCLYGLSEARATQFGALVSHLGVVLSPSPLWLKSDSGPSYPQVDRPLQAIVRIRCLRVWNSAMGKGWGKGLGKRQDDGHGKGGRYKGKGGWNDFTVGPNRTQKGGWVIANFPDVWKDPRANTTGGALDMMNKPLTREFWVEVALDIGELVIDRMWNRDANKFFFRALDVLVLHNRFSRCLGPPNGRLIGSCVGPEIS